MGHVFICSTTSPEQAIMVAPYPFPDTEFMNIMIVSEKWATDLAEFCGLLKEQQNGVSWLPATHVFMVCFRLQL